jgi:hypothetical protein
MSPYPDNPHLCATIILADCQGLNNGVMNELSTICSQLI